MSNVSMPPGKGAVAVVAAMCVWCCGCRPTEPVQFTPSAEVTALTDDLDDDEELALYQGLQREIGEILRKRTGEPHAMRLLGAGEETGGGADSLRLGARLYSTYCVQCHGVNGDGRGGVAVHLDPRPRDYTLGLFKFSSTSNGKPRRADLIETLRRGVRGTSMPSFANLSSSELAAVADYVLALTYRGELQRTLAQIAYDDGELPDEEGLDDIVEELLVPWREANSSVVMPLTPMPPMTAESIADGHALFLKYACSRCHGNDGRGGSLGNVDVGVDAWGRKAAAADLTSGMFRGGGRPIDLYRRIHSGITGSPMPGFANEFAGDPDIIWHLVHFIKETGQIRRRGQLPGETTPEVGDASAAETDGDEAEAVSPEQSNEGADEELEAPDVGASAEDAAA
ncbi:MAG TPA: c-type cytochrome [Lacipirellulaceae bacterium]|nr:c-type cytochrome [Lacipirellulaceae bacterium]